MSTEIPQRLQKILAQRGVGSRREIESWIVAGQIQVNGKTAVLGTKVLPHDQIKVSGRAVPSDSATTVKPRVILYNKPIGEICTRSDPQGRITVFSHLPKLQDQRWISVGRLDINSSGLILFTTDGELAHRLMHPAANIEREYAVRVLGPVTKEIISNLLAGVILDDGTAANFKTVNFVGGGGANSWYNVTLTQGRYREVRRAWESQGLRVSRLIRIRFGAFTLPRDLPEGKFVDLEVNDVESIL